MSIFKGNIPDGILFTGKQFYCTEGDNAGKLLVFNGTDWQEV